MQLVARNFALISLIYAGTLGQAQADVYIPVEPDYTCPAGSAPLILVQVGSSSSLGCFDPPPGIWVPEIDLPEVPLDDPAGGQFPITPPVSTPNEALAAGVSYSMNGHGDCDQDGNPVNILTRNKYQREVDFVGPGQLPLSIIRHYSSYGSQGSSFKGPFGQGWASNVGEKIIAASFPDPTDSPQITEVIVRNDSGYRFRLKSIDGGDWKTASGRVVQFAYDDTAEMFSWVDNGLIKVFHKSGDLQSITHESGEHLTYHYVENSSPSRIEKITHSYGGELSFTYDPLDQGRISIITGSSGEQWKYFYDSDGNLDYVTRPGIGASDTVDYSYVDSSQVQVPHDNFLSAIKYPDDSSTDYAEFGYDALGRASFSAHKNGLGSYVDRVDFVELSGTDLTIQTTNPHGKKAIYTYQDSAGLKRLTQVDGVAHGTCAASNSTYTYDANGFYDKTTDKEGNVVDHNYNVYGQLESMTTGFGTSDSRTTTQTWNTVWNKVETISTPLLDTVFELDPRGRVTKITHTNKSQYGFPNQQRIWDIDYETYTDSPIVKKVTVDGPRTDVDDTITYDYDANGRLSQITQTVTSQLNLVTTFGNHDAYGRVRRITTPAGMTRDITYHPRGYPLTVTDTVDGQVRQTQFEYYASGGPKKVTLSHGGTTEFSYDPARRLGAVVQDDSDTDPDDIRWKNFSYDTASNLTTESIWEKDWGWVPDDPNCNPFLPPFPQCTGSMQLIPVLKYDMDYEYDSLDRMTKIDWDYYGRDTEFTYNKNNQLATAIDSYGRSTSFAYDSNTDIDTTTYRDGGVSDVDYDTSGNISGIRDALGQWTYYRRDGFGQAWEIVSPATGTTYFEYDSAGNLTKKTDARGTILNYEYDALNRLDNVKVGASTTPLQAFEYDTNRPGYLYQVTDEAGTHTFTRNQAGEILMKSSVLPSATVSVSYTYNNMGQVDTMTYPSGLVVDYVYDGFGDVDKISASGAGLATSDVVTDVAHFAWGPVRHFTYGNGEFRTHSRNTDYELTYFSSGSHINQRLHQRDLNGNITSFDNRTFTYDEMDRVATHSGPDGSYEYDYDLNGNRDWHKKNGVITNYVYNSAKTQLDSRNGQISESRLYDANDNTTSIGSQAFDYNDNNRLWRYGYGSQTVTYTYNAFGERMIKQEGSTTTRFVYDGPSLLHEETGSTSRDYIYLDGRIVGLVQANTLYYVHNDHIGRPEVVSDSAQQKVWEAENNAFGNLPVLDAIGGFNVGFPGQYHDIESGLSYNYFRNYDPTSGRYLQSDPIGLDGGLNTYTYVGGNPINYIDPTGQNAAVGGVAGGIILDGVIVAGAACVGAPETCEEAIAEACDVAAARINVANMIIKIVLHGPDAVMNEINKSADGADDRGAEAKREKRRKSAPTNKPPGTKPIDKDRRARGKVHDIKPDIGAAPDVWVGVTPDGDIVTTSPENGETIWTGVNVKDY